MRIALIATLLAFPALAGEADPAKAFLGAWHGTSTCTDRKVAPACKDEVVVYEVRAGEKPGTAVVKADKIVDGERQWMGDLNATWDEGRKEWRSEIENGRLHVVWRLRVDGEALGGTLEQVPGGATIRRVALSRGGF